MASDHPNTSDTDRCLQEIPFGNWAQAVDWSPDGTRLAVSGLGGIVEVLTAEGRRLWRQAEHPVAVYSVRWSPDGQELASVSTDGTVCLWDARQGTVRFAVRNDRDSLAVSWSPDGRRLACGSVDVSIVDTRTGKILETWVIPKERACGVAFSPDGAWLAAGCESGRIRLRDEESRRELEPYEGHAGQVCQLAWTRDSQRLASASWDGTARIWNVAERNALVLAGHSGHVKDVAFSPDGVLLASASSDQMVHLWRSETGEEIVRLHGHESVAWGVAFSPDGTRVASASPDMTVRVWDVADLYPVRSGRDLTVSFDDYVVRQAATVGRRPRMAAPSLWVPRLASAAGDILGEFQGTGGVSGAVDVFPDSRSLMIGGGDGSLQRLDLETGSPIWHVPKAHEKSLNDVMLSPDSRLVASASIDSTAKVTDVVTGQTISSFSQNSGDVTSVAWSPDSKLVATPGQHERIIHIWNVRTSTPVAQCQGHQDHVSYLDWSPNVNLLASASDDGTVRIWRPADGVELYRHELHQSEVLTVRWAPDGRFLASAAIDGTILVWEPGTKRESIRCNDPTNQVNSIAWSPDGRLLAAGGRGQEICLWNLEGGQELHRFSREKAETWRLAWAPNGAFLAASVDRDVIRLRDVRKFLHPQSRLQPTTSSPRSLSLELKPLPDAFVHLARLDTPCPLSHLRVLLSVLSGVSASDATAEPLASHLGIRQLVALRWPASSRPGLVALLLNNVSPPCSPQGDNVERPDGWNPPPAATPTKLRDALVEALTGEPTTPEAPPLPVAALLRSADAIDDRLLTLLYLVGPDAIAADPSLPVRLLPQASKLPALTTPKRRLLGLRLRLDTSGPSHGHGPGAERTGIDVRGDWRTLLPWQLALPDNVLRGRHARHEMLYRSRSGEEPPRLRPTVLVLDISPPIFGPVERATRLAASVIAASLLDASLPAILVTAGGRGSVRTLERPADLVDLWTLRSLETADEDAALRVARAMRETLADDGLTPVVVLLSHVFFGADADVLPEVPGLRGFFVQYPGQPVRPPLAAACERWESVEAGEVEGLEGRLGRLVG